MQPKLVSLEKLRFGKLSAYCTDYSCAHAHASIPLPFLEKANGTNSVLLNYGLYFICFVIFKNCYLIDSFRLRVMSSLGRKIRNLYEIHFINIQDEDRAAKATTKASHFTHSLCAFLHIFLSFSLSPVHQASIFFLFIQIKEIDTSTH